MIQFLNLILKGFFLQFLNVCRYGIRGCYRHLCYLSDLLDKCEKQIVIDPTLIHFSYAYCASHVHGNRYLFFRVHIKGTVSVISIEPPNSLQRWQWFTTVPLTLHWVQISICLYLSQIVLWIRSVRLCTVWTQVS